MTYPFLPLPNAHAIAMGLNDIPDSWSLVAVWGKAPKQLEWQTASKQEITALAQLIIEGEERVSTNTGNLYRWWASGFGLRLGDYSDGLIAIDIDGLSVQPILSAISGGDIPKTVSWTSRKEGRSQMLFQIPAEFRESLANFQRKMITQWGDLECKFKMEKDKKKYIEGLELRYNRTQSVLPPSYHPTTGGYKWINSVEDTEIAIAPQWLIDLLLKVHDESSGGGSHPKWEEYKRVVAKGLSPSQDVSEFLLYNVYPRLSPEQIFNWSGHNFKSFGKTLKGNPPWRTSASGTSFHVWQADNQWCWQDKQLGCGGGAIAYRHMLNGGDGKPRGKEFIAIAKQLTLEAGLDFPQYSRDFRAIAISGVEEDLQSAIEKAHILRKALSSDKDEIKSTLLRRTIQEWDKNLKPKVWRQLDHVEKIEIQRLLRLEGYDVVTANADILKSVVDGEEQPEEKSDMIRTLVEHWEPEFKRAVWGDIATEDRLEIKRLLALPIPEQMPAIAGF